MTRVADGDTLEATAAGESGLLRIRLQGIDASEQGEVFGREALGFLRTLVLAQAVRINVGDIDRYGRLVARVSAAGTDASVALVRAGLACHAYAADTALARDEAQARKSGVGFWAPAAKKPACVAQTPLGAVRLSRPNAASNAAPAAAPRVTAPSTTPRTAAAPSKLQYRGNASSGLYHSSSCPNFTCKNCTRLFATDAEARAAGFRPASDCAKSDR